MLLYNWYIDTVTKEIKFHVQTQAQTNVLHRNCLHGDVHKPSRKFYLLPLVYSSKEEEKRKGGPFMKLVPESHIKSARF